MNDLELYKYYEEEIYNQPNNTIKDNDICVCENSIIVTDKDNYYNCCSHCGLCISYTNVVIDSYESRKNAMYVPNRRYTKLSYLRIKLNILLRNKKPIADDICIKKMRKKIKNMSINSVIKYMKKNKLTKYDPIKTFYELKNKKCISLSEDQFIKLLHDFNNKERVYKEHNIKRFNYNFLLLKIFEEWKNTELIECVKLLQSDGILNKHQLIYDRIFN